MAASISVSDVSDLMKYYGLTNKDCNSEVKEAHLEDLSRIVGKEWRSLPSHLGIRMPSITKNDIDRNFKTEKEKRYALFCQWKEMNGSAATYERLIMALLAINCRADAESVCKMLKPSSLSQEIPRSEDFSPEASADPGNKNLPPAVV